MARTSNTAPEVVATSVVAASKVNEITSTESNELRGTLRERLAQYDYERTEAGALIETWWHLVKDEPVSTTHADAPVTESGVILLPNDAKGRENSKLWTNFSAGRSYASEDGRIQFVCKYKLTPISKTEDGKNSGKKCYFTLEGTKDGKEFTLRDVEVTKVKNFLFGKGGWTSQKGASDGVPHSEEEVKTMAEKWEANLSDMVNELEEILESYIDDGDMPDFTPIRECIKVRTYAHAEALYLAWKEEEDAKEAERKEASDTKKAKAFKAETEEDAIAILAKTGLDLDKLAALLANRGQQA